MGSFAAIAYLAAAPVVGLLWWLRRRERKNRVRRRRPIESAALARLRDAHPPAPEIDDAAVAEQLEFARSELHQSARRHAGWLFTIAGFTLLNTMLVLGHAGLYFPIGLTVSSIGDVLADQHALENPEQAWLARGLAIGFDVVAAGAFAWLGRIARRPSPAAFVAGIAVYGVDGLLCLLEPDWLGLGLHAMGVAGLARGLSVCRRAARLGPDEIRRMLRKSARRLAESPSSAAPTS